MVEFPMVMVIVMLIWAQRAKKLTQKAENPPERPPTKNLAPEEPKISSIEYTTVYSFWYIYTFKSWVSGHIGGALTSCFALRWSFTSVPPGCAHHSGQIKTTIVIVVIIIVIIIVLVSPSSLSLSSSPLVASHGKAIFLQEQKFVLAKLLNLF